MDDDYVAQLMAKEAAENSKKYSLEGLGAYQSQKYAQSPFLLPFPYKKVDIFSDDLPMHRKPTLGSSDI